MDTNTFNPADLVLETKKTADAKTASVEAAQMDTQSCADILVVGVTREVMFEVVGWRHASAADPAPANPVAGDIIYVARQPDNPRDPSALVVQNELGKKLGFLRRGLAAVLSPLIDVSKLHFSQCSVHRWNDHASCVIRAVISGALPHAAAAFEVSANADNDAPRDQLSEFFCSICRVVLARDRDLFTSEQHAILTRIFAPPAASCASG